MKPGTRCVLVFFVASGLLAAQTSGTQFYTVEKEVALGRQVAEDTRKRTTPIASVEAQEFADRVAKRLSEQVTSPFAWNVEVVTGLPGNPTHEPPVLLGGFLFIPADLILAAHSEDEFAGMLAHAMAHVANRDITRAASFNQSNNYGTIPLIFIGSWQDASAIPQGLLKNVKEFEAKADVTAAGILHRAGYDPWAFVRYIARVQPETTRGQSAFPQRNARLAALEAAIEALGANGFLTIQEHVREQVGRPSPHKAPSLLH